MADAYIGEIRLFAGNYEPQGWMFCDGRSLPVSQYSTLYELLGTTYGGDGSTTFNLPDLRGRAPMGWGAGPGLTGRSLGATAGAPTVALTNVNMPPHTHTVKAKASGGGSLTNDPTGNIWNNVPSSEKIYADTANTSMNANTVAPFTGGNGAHNNVQPCMGINYIICNAGYYPTSS